MMVDTGWRDAHFHADRLEAALDLTFTADGRHTMAALVLHDGRLVAERHPDGVSAETPLHGWSMTKSRLGSTNGIKEDTPGFVNAVIAVRTMPASNANARK